MNIESARLLFTALQPDDRSYFEALHTDGRVREFLGGPLGSEAAHDRFQECLEPKSADRIWAIRLKPDISFIGTVEIHIHHNGLDTEISYLFLPQFWGNGYASEAVQRVIAYAMSERGLSRIVAETQTANLPSRRLLARVGMTKEQTLLRFGAEQAIYAVTKEPYNKVNSADAKSRAADFRRYGNE